MAIESRPMSFMSARRRRPNSSRAIDGICTAPAAVLRRADFAGLLMDGRGAGRRLLAARRRELDEQELRTDAHEFHDLGERDLVLFVVVARIDSDLGDLGEVTDD